MLNLFNELPIGIPLRAFDACAVSQEDIQKYQIAAWRSLRPADQWAYGYLLQNAYRPPERPLDERFADFSARLDAAIERRKHSGEP